MSCPIVFTSTPTLALTATHAFPNVRSRQSSRTRTFRKIILTGRRSTSTKLPSIQSSVRRFRHFTAQAARAPKNKTSVQERAGPLRRAFTARLNFCLTFFRALRQDGRASSCLQSGEHGQYDSGRLSILHSLV